MSDGTARVTWCRHRRTCVRIRPACNGISNKPHSPPSALSFLYDVPHRTGVTIAPDTVTRLIEFGNIVAIKECVKEHFSALRGLPINVLCGTDEALDDCLNNGGTGGILASAHVCADLLVAVQDLIRADREPDERNLFASLLPVLRLLFAAPNPSAIKAMLAFDHAMTDETRMPITRASAQLVERLSTRARQVARPARRVCRSDELTREKSKKAEDECAANAFIIRGANLRPGVASAARHAVHSRGHRRCSEAARRRDRAPLSSR